MTQPNTTPSPEAPVSGASDALEYATFLMQKQQSARPNGIKRIKLPVSRCPADSGIIQKPLCSNAP